MLKRKNWNLIQQTGYTFVFESQTIRNVELKIFAMSEDEAWRKLDALK